jgi:hypothetical protein
MSYYRFPVAMMHKPPEEHLQRHREVVRRQQPALAKAKQILKRFYTPTDGTARETPEVLAAFRTLDEAGLLDEYIASLADDSAVVPAPAQASTTPDGRAQRPAPATDPASYGDLDLDAIATTSPVSPATPRPVAPAPSGLHYDANPDDRESLQAKATWDAEGARIRARYRTARGGKMPGDRSPEELDDDALGGRRRARAPPPNPSHRPSPRTGWWIPIRLRPTRRGGPNDRGQPSSTARSCRRSWSPHRRAARRRGSR